MRGAVTLLLLTILASCSPQPEQRSSDGGVSTSDSPAWSIPAVAVPEEPDHLVPPLARSPASAAIWSWVLPSLVRIELDQAGKARFVGDIAVSWQIEDEGMSARFVLGHERRWDDTTSVNVADVTGSYGLYLDRRVSGDWARRLSEISTVEPDHTSNTGVIFRFRRPLSKDRIMQLASLPLVSIDQWTATLNRRPALGQPGRPVDSAGPFRVAQWEPGEFIRLERHPFPPEGRVSAAQRIVLRFVGSGRARAMQLEQGVVQLATDLPSDEVTRLSDGPYADGLTPAGATRFEALVWNLDDPSWGRIENRRGVSACLDLDRLQAVFAGDASVVSNKTVLSLVGSPALSDSHSIMAAPDAEDLPPLELLYVTSDAPYERAAVEIALQLNRLGAQCDLLPCTIEECMTRIEERRFQAVLVGYTAPPVLDLGEILGSDGAYNIAGLRDSGIDELIVQARSASADTIPHLWQLVEQSATELMPYILLARSTRIDGVDPRVGSYTPDPLEQYGNLLGIHRPESIPIAESR